MTSPTPSQHCQPMKVEPFDFPRELRCDSVILDKSHPYTADMLKRAAAEIERLHEVIKGATAIVNVSGSLLKEKDEKIASLKARIAELESEQYLVFSNQNRAWWRANSSGYTTDIRGAGFYSREEAISISAQSRDGWRNPADLPCELAIPVSSLPEKIRAILQPKGAE